MSIQAPTWERGAERQMGHVYANITIRNRIDEALFERGQLGHGQVRTLTLERVMVDTGATTLALPASMMAELGLTSDRETPVRTATGTVQARIFRDASLTVEGRSGSFECMELADGAQPLLGVLPLEALGIEPDIINHRLRLLPEEPGGETHYFLMGWTELPAIPTDSPQPR